jgi:hypothetical protein
MDHANVTAARATESTTGSAEAALSAIGTISPSELEAPQKSVRRISTEQQRRQCLVRRPYA